MGSGGMPKQTQYEPIKSAAEVMKGASAETSRAQQLRNGITSTFSRSSMGRKASASSATSGTAAKLGG